MSNIPDYSSLFKTANAAVQPIEDQYLKAAAFGAILNHLLATPQSKGQGISEFKQSVPVKEGPHKKKKNGPVVWIGELIDGNFFAQPKAMTEILLELETRSHHLRAADLTAPLQRRCHARQLRRTKRILESSGKEVLHWSNW